MLDPRWLFSAAPALIAVNTLAIAVGDERSKAAVDLALAAVPAAHKGAVKPSVERYGTHHSKFFLLGYEAGLRVIVVVREGRGGRVGGAAFFPFACPHTPHTPQTGNAIAAECDTMTQAVWWQDVPWAAAGGAAPATGWGQTLAAYIPRLGFAPPLQTALLAMVARADFTSMRADVVATVPGSHARLDAWGHGALAAALARCKTHHPALVGAPVVAQSSSLGVLNPNQIACYVRAMSGGASEAGAPLGPPTVDPPLLRLALVWPTVDEVRNSVAGWESGGSIPGFPNALASDEVRPRLCSWSGGGGRDPACRSNVMPHIKSYVRYTAEGRLAWAVVGSANFSAAAWGLPTPHPPKATTKQYNRSFELSVVLTPDGEAAHRAHRDYGFCATPYPSDWSLSAAPPPPPPAPTQPTVRFWTAAAAPDAEGGCEVVAVPLPYALPPARYGPGDRPWTLEPHPGLDAFGRTVEQVLGGGG